MQDDSIIWKPVIGYEGSYVVAESGSVRSLGRINSTCYGSTRVLKSKQMTTSMDSRGYICVKLSSNNKTTTHRVHRLVMMAFSPNENHASLDVNHKDGNKQNNPLSNLEWCTRGENHRHRYQVLGQKHSFVGRTGSKHARSKPVIGTNVKTGEKVMFESANQAAINMGMCFSKICACARGKRATHKGYAWGWYGPEEMKRNWDTVRKILLAVENCREIRLTVYEIGCAVRDDYQDDNETIYNIMLLLDAGFICRDTRMLSEVWIAGMTWKGHDLLDQLRDKNP